MKVIIVGSIVVNPTINHVQARRIKQRLLVTTRNYKYEYESKH